MYSEQNIKRLGLIINAALNFTRYCFLKNVNRDSYETSVNLSNKVKPTLIINTQVNS